MQDGAAIIAAMVLFRDPRQFNEVFRGKPRGLRPFASFVAID
jgi:hypothetical protein